MLTGGWAKDWGWGVGVAGSTEEVLVYFRVMLRSVSETNRRSWVTEPQGELSFGSCTLYYLALNENHTKANCRRGLELGYIYY